jgi:deoxyhypusine synthase
MKRQSLHDGRADGLTPLESLSLSEVDSFADLLRAMAKTAFAGRQLGEAFDILLEMFRDPECTVVVTISGAMTVGKQGRVICDMIDRGFVQIVVATGALIAHGLTESIGLVHYRHDPSRADETLYHQGYNRIYDTLEMETNLNDVERFVDSVLQSNGPAEGAWSSSRLCRALGRRLSELDEGPGILRSAYERDVPVFLPALTDSELGLDLAISMMRRAMDSREDAGRGVHLKELLEVVPDYNAFLDLQQYAGLMSQAPCAGILTIGGGVPRNWSQQVGPYIDLIRHRLKVELQAPCFRYAVRICPEPVHWGGLSGCTYSEGVSWGKFMPRSEGGRFAEVYCDATAVLPLLIKAVCEEMEGKNDE